MGDVNVELNKASTTPISLNDPAVRTLFIKQGDQTTISLGDGRGKSNIGAVTSLAVTPNTTTVLSTTVTWALPATGTITKYEVYGKTAADTVTKQALQTFTTAPFPTTATLTGLKSGTAYTIYVTTSNASASTNATVPVTTLAYSFPFTAVTASDPNTLNTSAEVMVSGFPNSWPAILVSVASTTNAYFAVSQTLGGANNFTTSANTSGYYAASASGTLYVRVRFTSGTLSTTNTATLTVGDVTSVFSVSTRGSKLTPTNTTPITFTTQSNASPSTIVKSDILTITGLESNYAVSLSIQGAGDGSGGAALGYVAASSYSAASAATTFSSSPGTYTTDASGNLYVRAQVTTSPLYDKTSNAVVFIGNGNASFTTQTSSLSFTIPGKTDQPFNTMIASDLISVTGLKYSTSYTITISAAAGVSVGVDAGQTAVTGSFTTGVGNTGATVVVTSSSTGTLALKVEVTSSSVISTVVSSTVTVSEAGGTSRSSSFSVTTRIPSITPTFNTPLFTAFTDVPFNQVVTSTEAVRVSGLEPSYDVSVSSAGGLYLCANSLAGLSSATWQSSAAFYRTNGSGELWIQARLTSSADTFSLISSCNITVGSGSASTGQANPIPFRVTTTASTFAFTAVLNASFNTVYTSATITVTGLPYNATNIGISAAGGTIDAGTSSLSGTFTTSKSNITATSTGTIVLAAKQTSSTNATTATACNVSVTFTINSTTYTKTGSYTVTTKTPVTKPNAFSFTALTGATRGSYYTSNLVTLVGMDAGQTTTVSASGGTLFYSTDGTTFNYANSVGDSGNSAYTSTTISTDNIYIKASGYASANYLGTTTVLVNYGGTTASFTITSVAETAPTSATISFASTTTSGTTITVTGNNTPSTYSLYETNSNYTSDLTVALTPTVTGGNVYSITGKTNNTTYYYRATAGNTGGSANTTNSFTTTLALPGTVTITAGTAAYNSVVLTFSTSGTNVGTPASYTVYRSSVNNDTSNLLEFAAASTSNPRTLTLTASTTYYFTAKANNTAGSSAVYSGFVTVNSPAQPPAAPSTISITFPSVTELGFTVRVNVGGGGAATQWYIQQYTNANYNIMTGNQLSSTSTNDFPLTGNSGTTYYFAGWASNGGGTATAAYNSVLLYPAAPSIAVGTVTYNSASLTFTTSGGTPASYSVWYSTTNANTNSLVSLATDTTSNPVTVTLSASSTYYFIAKSKNATGSSGYGNFTSLVTTPAQPVAAPSSVTIAQSNNAATSFTVTVSAGAGGAATSYTIKNYTNANYTTLANPQFSFTPNGATFGVTGLTQSSSYYIKGFATNAGGTGESGGNTYSTLAAAPTGVGITVSTAATTTTVTLTVSSSGGGTPTSYWIEKYANSTYTGTPVTSASQAGGVFPLTGLTAGTPYYYKGVAATNSGASIGRSAGANPTFTTTTALDTTPDAFSFTATTGATLGSVYTSDAVLLTGLSGSTLLTGSVSGGSMYASTDGFVTSYNVISNPNSFVTAANGTISIKLRGTASSTNGTKVTVTGTVGGVSGTYDITTIELVPGLSTNRTINKITNTGFTIKWDPPTTGGTPTGYYVNAQASGVFYYPAEGDPVPAPTTTATFTGLASNTQYYLGIIPFNSAGLNLNWTGFYVYPAVYYTSTTLAAGATFTYAFTAPTADTFYFTAEGISDGTLTLDTILNISAPTGTPKTWNNDDATGFTPSGRGSQIAITTVQGRVYTCKVTGFSTATSPYKNNGAFTFSISRTQSRG